MHPMEMTPTTFQEFLEQSKAWFLEEMTNPPKEKKEFNSTVQSVIDLMWKTPEGYDRSVPEKRLLSLYLMKELWDQLSIYTVESESWKPEMETQLAQWVLNSPATEQL